MVRVTSRVTSVSWIPSGLVDGLLRLPFAVGLTSYDRPLPDRLGDLTGWQADGRFRFANRLEAWIDTEDGEVTGAGYSGGGLIGRTGLGPGKLVSVPAIAFADLRQPPEPVDGGVRFVQTAGGQPPLLAPRRVTGSQRWTLRPPLVWTTLALTLSVDGSASWEVRGSSRFPRHWIYDAEGHLASKVGVTDFDQWYHHASLVEHSPWGGAEDAVEAVTDAGSPLERALSDRIMAVRPRPELRRLPRGELLVRQGETDDTIYLVLDGVLEVEVDGRIVASVGPGVVVGERATVDAAGRRTATLRAVTHVRVAMVPRGLLAGPSLALLAEGHRREAQAGTEAAAPDVVDP